MLSGDHGAIAEEVCRQVGIAPDRCFARLLPQQKCDWIRAAQGHTRTQGRTQGPEGGGSGPTYGDLEMVPKTETETVGPDLEKAEDPDPDPDPEPASRPVPRRVLMIGDGMIVDDSLHVGMRRDRHRLDLVPCCDRHERLLRSGCGLGGRGDGLRGLRHGGGGRRGGDPLGQPAARATHPAHRRPDLAGHPAELRLRRRGQSHGHRTRRAR